MEVDKYDPQTKKETTAKKTPVDHRYPSTKPYTFPLLSKNIMLHRAKRTPNHIEFLQSTTGQSRYTIINNRHLPHCLPTPNSHHVHEQYIHQPSTAEQPPSGYRAPLTLDTMKHQCLRTDDPQHRDNSSIQWRKRPYRAPFHPPHLNIYIPSCR